MADCIWGKDENDSDCIGGMHAFVTCINCGEMCDDCIYEKAIEKQTRECTNG